MPGIYIHKVNPGVGCHSGAVDPELEQLVGDQHFACRPDDLRTDRFGCHESDPERVYRDKLSGTSTREQRPGLAALLDYARPGDAIVVVGIDRLGRNAAEVMTTIRELRDREIVLRSLREGIDTSNATGRMVAGVLASLAELELELGRERRAAAREARRARGQAIGRPKALDASKAALARRMHSSGEPVSTIANTLAVSRATVYRVLAEADETDRNQGQAAIRRKACWTATR